MHFRNFISIIADLKNENLQHKFECSLIYNTNNDLFKQIKKNQI